MSVTQLERGVRLAWWLSVSIGLLAVGLVVADLLRVPGVGDWPAWPPWLPWVGVALAAIGLGCALWLDRRLHRARRDTPDDFLLGDDEERVVAAIRAFESRTSGEIRVHLAYDCTGDPLATAIRLFEQFGMTRTRQRNGVLFYVAVHEHRLAVVGDEGIDRLTDPGFWDGVVQPVEAAFRKGDFVGGLLSGIELAGEALVRHFPPDPDDLNELPDELTRS